ncbi:GL11606 [Drosophila persimilis]|uniref:GL11606 n=1 Tax=Drosophila persimilis TaxID=7234 RepID=B4GC41_DROPE|nr:GL11606 [Drosophila persimilis]
MSQKNMIPVPRGCGPMALSIVFQAVFSAFPDRSPSVHPLQDRSARLAKSKPNKPSSSFDLAIDNYLKDFGCGNQGRSYVGY